ncbi:MAG TPA: serine hydrolase, partial [Defluviitaleaceae bacterium]|nr:serine hydrolase [Defluviitaleaceae bacterium]
MMKKKSIFLSGFLALFIITVLLVFSNNKIIESFYSAPHDEELTDISDNILEGSESKEEDFDTEYLSYIDTFIESEIDKGFPGAVLLVMKDGKVVKHTAYGYKLKYENGIELSNPIAMTEDTLFDLASNTKIYATTLAIIKLVDEGRIHLTDPVEK